MEPKGRFCDLELDRGRSKPEPPRHEPQPVIEEARMVLPGIQAFFGFQPSALLLVALSSAPVMAPAAYHRLAERSAV
jgi:hypothetical protein